MYVSLRLQAPQHPLYPGPRYHMVALQLGAEMLPQSSAAHANVSGLL